jgi:DNA-binding winged helix-turn-helix (wHTH) protein
MSEQVSFGRFRLDLGQRELLRDGVPLRLGIRAFDILCVLVAAKGGIVSKDELMARVWSGLVVEESNIHVHVSALRKALGDGATGQSLVVTVPGRGYRFVGLPPAPAIDNRELDPLPALPLPDRPFFRSPI